jgi:flagellar biosynthetic protein FliP
VITLLLGVLTMSFNKAYGAESVIDGYLNGGNNTSDIVRLIVVLTLLSFIPAIIMTLTAFPRIIIVLSFARNAMGTQQMPPNQVLIGIALVLTFFIMSPVVTEVIDEAYTPYMEGEIGTEEAYESATRPLKEFMFNQAKTEPKGMNFFMDLYGMTELPESLDDMPMVVVMMSFITSELKKAFIMGFILYVPFIVVDMITASVLMSMGMMMIPPVTISLPFKILLFVLVDGWTLLFETLVKGFI